MVAFTSEKLTMDVLISIFATSILATTVLSISTNSWNLNNDHDAENRTGLFQQCTQRFCCEAMELDRSITFLVLFSVILLVNSTFISFLLMASNVNGRNRCYLLIPMTFFIAGITMSLSLVRTLDRIALNGYSAYLFMIDTVLAYLLGGISLFHGTRFYF